jgi:hypothetical protein
VLISELAQNAQSIEIGAASVDQPSRGDVVLAASEITEGANTEAAHGAFIVISLSLRRENLPVAAEASHPEFPRKT